VQRVLKKREETFSKREDEGGGVMSKPLRNRVLGCASETQGGKRGRRAVKGKNLKKSSPWELGSGRGKLIEG